METTKRRAKYSRPTGIITRSQTRPQQTIKRKTCEAATKRTYALHRVIARENNIRVVHKPSFVYVCSFDDEEGVKIGRSIDTSARKATLQCGKSSPLEMVHIATHDDVLHERIVHRVLEHERIDRRREIFDVSFGFALLVLALVGAFLQTMFSITADTKVSTVRRILVSEIDRILCRAQSAGVDTVGELPILDYEGK